MTRRVAGMIGRAAVAAALVLISIGCPNKKAPVARPLQPGGESGGPVTAAPAQPSPAAVAEAAVVPTPAPVVPDDPMAARSVDDLNRDSPFKPVFYGLDSAELSPEARAVLDEASTTLKTYTGWTITIEGHCDERGTAEYNLALGERRAVAAQAYLVSLGVAAGRVRTVSYGKEFPFDPGHNEAAWARNRRAHIIITGK